MIELKEHNKRPYGELCRMLEAYDKCAYVSATGTGKSYVVGKYIEDHDLVDKTLMLVPSVMIAENWESLLPGISCLTYQGMASSTPYTDDIDLIVCDEMHHLGGDVWGTEFQKMMESYQGKLIGMSATPIRYLDNSRDMADEIFGECVVEGYSLPQAISEGILPSFQYISALYSMPKSKKYQSTEYTEALIRKLDWMENEYSVQSILEKYLPKDQIKVAVFVDKISELKNIRNMCRRWYPDAWHREIHSGMNKSDVAEILSEFQASEKMSFLYTVDMLNEGIHIDGVRSIIMFRKTTSPAVYLQQLGRTLCSNNGGVRPIIFDFVANHACIKCSNHAGGSIQMLQEAIDNPERQLIITDYAKEELEVLHQLDFAETGHWTKAEDDILRENYKAKTDMQKVVDLLPHRTRDSINGRIGYLGLAISCPRYESQFDEDIMTYFAQPGGMKKLKGLHPRANAAAIHRHAEKLGLYASNRVKRWTEQEIAILLDTDLDFDDPKWLELLPDRTLSTIKTKKQHLLRKPREVHEIDEEKFKELFQAGGVDEVHLSSEFAWMPLAWIKDYAKTHNIQHLREGAWTDEEVDRIIDYLHSPIRVSIPQFALTFPERNAKAVEEKIRKLRKQYGSVKRINTETDEWTSEETQLIYDYLSKPVEERESIRDFSLNFDNRNYNAVKNKVNRERQKEATYA